MKCFICKNLVLDFDKCKECHGKSLFEPKTEKDIIAEGLQVFNLKMAMPQYAAYLDNDKAQERLLLDCVNEAKFRSQTNTKTVEMLNKKGVIQNEK